MAYNPWNKKNVELLMDVNGVQRSVVLDYEFCLHCYAYNKPSNPTAVPVEVYPVNGNDEVTFYFPFYKYDENNVSNCVDMIALIEQVKKEVTEYESSHNNYDGDDYDDDNLEI